MTRRVGGRLTPGTLLWVVCFAIGSRAIAEPPGVVPSSPLSEPATIQVRLETSLGAIDLEVDTAHAPLSAANFLRYVDAGRYDGARFHRTVTLEPDNQPGKTVKIEVIQAGVAPERSAQDFAPVPLERTRDTGLRHGDGCLSMARDKPDTATSDFFLCIGAQPELDFGGRRNPDGQGFAVFGRVVAGMEVVRAIHRSPADGQTLTPPVAIRRAFRILGRP